MLLDGQWGKKEKKGKRRRKGPQNPTVGSAHDEVHEAEIAIKASQGCWYRAERYTAVQHIRRSLSAHTNGLLKEAPHRSIYYKDVPNEVLDKYAEDGTWPYPGKILRNPTYYLGRTQLQRRMFTDAGLVKKSRLVKKS